MKTLSHSASLVLCRRDLFFLLFVLLALTASAQTISFVSIPSGAPTGGSSDSLSPILSADGRYILFATLSTNVALPNTTNIAPAKVPYLNVYLRDRLTLTTKLVSVSSNGVGGGNGDSQPRGISTNGQFALFESAASNLVAGDVNGTNDIFIRDLAVGVTIRVNLSTNGTSANNLSSAAVMTPDGRYVAFVSSANNLTANDTNGIADIFVRDLQSGTTVCASEGARSSVGGNSDSPIITPQGRYVAFYSTATNLVGGITNRGEIFVRDLVANTTTWASTNSHSHMLSLRNNSAARSSNFEISDDGRYVAYEACPLASGASWSTWGGIMLRHDLATGLTIVVNTNVAGIASGSELFQHSINLTPDGRFLAYVANALGTNGTATAIQVWDAQNNTNIAATIDLANSTPTNALCEWPSISPNGRYVAFLSNATNLVANPIVAGFHLYVRDLQANTNRLVDVDGAGSGSVSNLLSAPQLTDDGLVVAFEALDGGGLVGSDSNNAYDVFVRSVPTAATELASSRMNTGSTIRVPEISWLRSPDSNYVVQFKDDIMNPVWQSLTGVHLVGDHALVIDATPDPTQRFYRVLEF